MPAVTQRWWIPAALAVLGAAVALLAPAERTLGDGIRWVYVHVGLVWAGTLALGLAAAGGVVLLATGRPRLEAGVRAVWWAGLAAFALGVAFSMVAARINWGAVALEEPRMAAALRFLAVAVIAAVAGAMVARPRVTALLAVVTFALLLWDVGGAELRMHPHDPVRTATSVAIQAAFALSFAVATALTAWLALVLRPRAA